MKLQYLRDSKDSFKWDYHDFLVNELRYPLFNIALMMTPDDGGSDERSHPSLFSARKEVIEFCHHLREHRSIASIKEEMIGLRWSSAPPPTLHASTKVRSCSGRRLARTVVDVRP